MRNRTAPVKASDLLPWLTRDNPERSHEPNPERQPGVDSEHSKAPARKGGTEPGKRKS